MGLCLGKNYVGSESVGYMELTVPNLKIRKPLQVLKVPYGYAVC